MAAKIVNVQPGPSSDIILSTAAKPAAAREHRNRFAAALAVAGPAGFMSTSSVPQAYDGQIHPTRGLQQDSDRIMGGVFRTYIEYPGG